MGSLFNCSRSNDTKKLKSRRLRKASQQQVATVAVPENVRGNLIFALEYEHLLQKAKVVPQTYFTL